MFRTLFFLRLECGQECVVALLALRGRKTYHAVMLEERKEERGGERSGDLKRSKGGKDKTPEESGSGPKKKKTARCC